MKRALIAVHRWLGVPLSLFFALWFPSAVGTMYWDFPTVTPQDRLARSAPIDPQAIAVTPAAALAAAGIDGAPADLRLNTFDGRPVYRIASGRRTVVVFGDTGAVRGDAAADVIRRAASRWTGRPEADARMDAVTAVDQWTVQGPLRTLRPLWKCTFGDGQQVYVAGATGEVVQYTTSASRLGAYLGPIPHWLYFTPLRQRQQLWTSTVIWSSGVATLAAALGLAAAIWMSAPIGRVPYRGQKRWHVVLGFVFGAGAVTWAFSGMMSMDPFASPPPAAPPIRLRDPLALEAFAARTPRQALSALAPSRVKELQWMSTLGTPAYLATLDDGTTRVVPIAGPPRTTFDGDGIAAALAAAGATVRTLDRYDAYYIDRHRRKPLPVLVATTRASRVYVDPATATVVATYGPGDWSKRWLYHGLHSLDLPWLYTRRPLWDALVIALMAGGTALSITSLTLAWRVARGFRRSPSMPRPATR